MARPFSVEPRRIFNFAAGPAVMPSEVLKEAQQELPNWNGQGLSILEMPFTGDEFKKLLRQARDDLRALLAIPDNYRILFMHGGASAQFSLVPLNLLGNAECAVYVDSGYWSRKAIHEARRYCILDIVEACRAEHIRPNPRAAYCHITTNETADGWQYRHLPESGGIPLVADMTSDFLSRPFDVSRFGLVYAGAQKNIGPTGLTIVIVRDDLLDRAHPATPVVFNYREQADADSMLNTPITFAVYLAGLVFRWIAAQGGLQAMEQRSWQRSERLYSEISASDGFYHSVVPPEHRSRMNVCFTLPDEALTQMFLAQAAWHGLVNLKGHSQTGGIRASLYNAMPDEGVAALASFMYKFRRSHARSL